MHNFFIKKNLMELKNLFMVVLFLSMTGLVTIVKAEELTTYGSLGEVVDIHNSKADYGIGHRRLREGDIRFTENGEVIGKYHLISKVVDINTKTKKETRTFLASVKLPEGSLWLEDEVEMDNKSLPNSDNKISGVILGGTQGYKGITGTFDLQLAADGKFYVVVYHIVRGK
jgi:hypothetical protein